MNSEHLSAADYARLAELIYNKAGIELGPDRQTMLGARIQRRLKALNYSSYEEYCNYLFGIHGQREELIPLIDVVTTNKTDFFREPAHFDYLLERALPEMIADSESGRPLLIWSAGCSTGEEPYTLAMLLSEYAETHSGFDFRLLATDISTSVLEKAQQAVFAGPVAAAIPAHLRRKYLMRSRNRGSDLVRIVPELRHLVEFRRLNFMDADYGVQEKASAIFCRNVIIYFDRPTQERILSKLAQHLTPRGYLFVGHAESLHEMNLPLRPVAPALYQKLAAMAEEQLREIYLQPGELQLVDEPAVIRTILGSCVGITFRHGELGLGGMCHPMLPSSISFAKSAREAEPSTRFVDIAIREMARRLDGLGALRDAVEVKLFGGGDVLPVHGDSHRPTVGRLNCEAALHMLEEEGFQVAASSLGGKCGVNIRFHTGTGEVLLRRLR